jgi:hypothetical protein
MPSGPFVKELQGVANASNVLAPPQRAIVLGDGLTYEDAPDVVLTGNGQSITGATRVKLSNGITVSADGTVYRYSSGIATVGKDSGLTEFRIRNPAGDGYVLDIAGGVGTFVGTISAAALTASGYARSDAGFVLGDEIDDATAAGVASALTHSWVLYKSGNDHFLKAVDEDGNVAVLGRPSQPSGYGTTTTSGAASSTLMTIAIPADAQVLLTVDIAAAAPGLPGSYTYASARGAGFSSGGSPAPTGPSAIEMFGTGIGPKVTAAYSMGVVTFTVTGPSATISTCADNGSGKVRVTVSSAILDTKINGMSVVIAGVTGTTEANGTHVATYVSATQFDLGAVGFVNPYTGGPGTVVYATPPTLDWVGSVRADIIAT